MIDERQKNNIKAVTAAVITLIFVSVLGVVFLVPIEQHQRNKIIEEHCPNLIEEPDCLDRIIIEPSFIWMLLGMPSVIVYFVSYRHFENKRIKTWKSWK